MSAEHPRPPEPRTLDEFERRGFIVVPDALSPRLRAALRSAAKHLLASRTTRGRDRGADGKDGFRGCVALDEVFLPLVANPRVLPTVVALLSPNIHLLSSQLITLPPVPADARRTIRVPERPGWHRDMYGVSQDLGLAATPRLAVKCAYYLTHVSFPESGMTTFLPGSHLRTEPVEISEGGIDPTGAVTPRLRPCDAVIFENRTWHAGGVNRSAEVRLAVMMQYGYRWLQPVDDPYPALDRPDLSPLERQLLGLRDRAPDGSLAKGAGATAVARWWEDLGGVDTGERRPPAPARVTWKSEEKGRRGALPA